MTDLTKYKDTNLLNLSISPYHPTTEPYSHTLMIIEDKRLIEILLANGLDNS
jgi:hypothetical protein